MIKNYFRIAWRNMTRNRTFSAINIFGLAIGMAACLLILQYVSFKLSYDQFHEHAPDIYRVINDRYQNGKLTQHSPQTYSAIGKQLQDDYPQEVADYARIEPLWSRILIYNDKKTEEGGLAVDNSFLSMFSFPLLAGDRATALQEPNSIIVTEKLARKLIDNDNPSSFVGQVVRIENDSVLYKITGVCKDIPENSHLQFSFLKSYISLYKGGNGSWKAANHSFKESFFWHYIQLKPGADYKRLQAKLPAFSERHFQGTKVTGSKEDFFLQPLSKAHLYSDYENEIGKTGSATLVWGLLLVAVFIILIAWINYINLATAKSVERAKEVGVRKAAGALRSQLVRMFLLESTMMNVVALVLAVTIVVLVQSRFNTLIGHQLSLSYLLEKGMSGYAIIGGLILVLIAGIFLSGYYPAFVLSSFNPVTVLKGRLTQSGKGVSLRKFLVVGQFAITTVLIISSIVVYKQLSFISNRGSGLDIEQVLVVKPPFLTKADYGEFMDLTDNFKEDLKQLAAVKGSGTTRRLPGNEMSRASDVYRIDDSTSDRFTLDIFGLSYDLMDVFDMKILAGRKFARTDHNAELKYVHNAILNEKSLQLLGFSTPEEAVGKQVSVFGKTYDIVGVVKDFHMQSLHHNINPMVLMPLSYTRQSAFAVKLNTTNIQQTVAAIRAKYEAWFPGNLFDYYFLDESYNAQYQNDRLFGKVFSIFTMFTILIACFGLFGLSLYTVKTRIKEIGVRKVLGASVVNIVMLLSRDMVKLVLIANIIAFPVSWWVMNSWLNDFAYRVDIGWWVFVLAIVIALLIAMGTLSFQAIKAAIRNPVKSLRTE
jgi:putative ABC transport system permease protein